MSWEQIRGNWNQATGHAREQWGKLTFDGLGLDVVAGHRDPLVGKLQPLHGVAQHDAERQMGAWQFGKPQIGDWQIGETQRTARDSWFTNVAPAWRAPA